MAGLGVTRRQFLGLLGAGALVVACARKPRRDRVGVALGGGGARGLAHVVILETLDELGIRPYRMAGTSIGAIFGALYAAGYSGKAIRALIADLLVKRGESWSEALFDSRLWKWWQFFNFQSGNSGWIDPSPFLKYLRERLRVSRFDQLSIPLKIVATDFWRREPVVLDSGPLIPAVHASMALPGLFPAVRYGARVLVDGGLVDPVPYDVLADCDVTIGVDVLGLRTGSEGEVPSWLEAMFNSVQILEATLIKEQLRQRAPTIFLRPEITGVRILEFYKAAEVYRQTQAARNELKRRLAAIFPPA